MDNIVRIQLQRVEKLLADRRMATWPWTHGPALAGRQRGYDPVYGARPLKRVIQKELVDPIARKLLAGDLEDGSVIAVNAGSEGLSDRRQGDTFDREALPPSRINAERPTDARFKDTARPEKEVRE